MLKQPIRTNHLPMTPEHQRIRQICDVLASTALQLGKLRSFGLEEEPEVRPFPPKLESFWGSTREDEHDEMSPETSYWYRAIEPLFEELERLIRMAPRQLCEAVIADPVIGFKAALLHQLRAAYEYDKEITLARAIAGSPAAESQLTRLIEQEAFWALSSELREALRGCRRIVIAGSGPLPLTALSIANELHVPVTAVECDTTAYDLGHKIIALAGYETRIHCVKSRIEQIAYLDHFDAVVGAVLVGVDTESNRHHRSEIANRLVKALAPGAKLVVREPHGLGQLFHPPLDLEPADHYKSEFLLPQCSPSTPYRSGIAVLHRLGAAIT